MKFLALILVIAIIAVTILIIFGLEKFTSFRLTNNSKKLYRATKELQHQREVAQLAIDELRIIARSETESSVGALLALESISLKENQHLQQELEGK